MKHLQEMNCIVYIQVQEEGAGGKLQEKWFIHDHLSTLLAKKKLYQQEETGEGWGGGEEGRVGSRGGISIYGFDKKKHEMGKKLFKGIYFML